MTVLKHIKVWPKKSTFVPAIITVKNAEDDTLRTDEDMQEDDLPVYKVEDQSK